MLNFSRFQLFLVSQRLPFPFYLPIFHPIYFHFAFFSPLAVFSPHRVISAQLLNKRKCLTASPLFFFPSFPFSFSFHGLGYNGFVFFFLVSVSSAEFSSIPGINYGQEGNNLSLPLKSMELIKSLKAKRVKIYDANPEILKALSNTNHEVSIMVPNQLIVNISSNQTLADEWVKTNVLPFYPQTLIRYLLVSNEVITSSPPEVWAALALAIRRIKHSLKHFGIRKVKVGTSLAMDVLESSFI